MAKLENVYEWTDLLFFAERNEIAGWNKAHDALVKCGKYPEYNHHCSVYRHLVEDQEQIDQAKRWNEGDYEIGDDWFETGPRKINGEDNLAYKIISGFMRKEDITEATFI